MVSGLEIDAVSRGNHRQQKQTWEDMGGKDGLARGSPWWRPLFKLQHTNNPDTQSETISITDEFFFVTFSTMTLLWSSGML